MGNQINFGTMKIRLEFLFRLLLTQNVTLYNKGLSEVDVQDFLSNMITEGSTIAFVYRRDHGFTHSEAELINNHGFGNVIADGFNSIARKIDRECAGLPITLTLGKKELIIKDGMSDLMKTIRELFKGKEVANG